MNKTLSILFFFITVSCDADKNIINSNITPIGNDEQINATSYSNWKYFRFTDSTLQEITFFIGDPSDNLSWDIAFQRNHIKTNSGTSGIGNAGAYIDSSLRWNATSFNNFNENVNSYIFKQDTLVETFYNLTTHTFSEGSTNPVLETWAVIDTLNNYTMNISNNKFIVRTRNGEKYYKFWVYDYYNEANQSGNISLIFDSID